MKIAIISDIHSNPTALLAALKDAKEKGCGRIVCLGDIVGYGYAPNECIEICKEHNVECLLGNHDAGVIGRLDLDWFSPFAASAIVRQCPLITKANKDWLRELPYNKAEGFSDCFAYAFSHGTYFMPEKFEYIEGVPNAALEFDMLSTKHIKILFVGHTHYAMTFVRHENLCIEEVYVSYRKAKVQELDRCDGAIVNVGSIGYPRNQSWSIYGIYDTENHEFQHQILPFDFDDYIVNMEKSGASVPVWMEHKKF